MSWDQVFLDMPHDENDFNNKGTSPNNCVCLAGKKTGLLECAPIVYPSHSVLLWLLYSPNFNHFLNCVSFTSNYLQTTYGFNPELPKK